MISAIRSDGDRGGVRRLQHHGVAGGQGRGPLPHRHHQRVVPRGHRRAHPDGLPADERGVVRPGTRRPTCPRGGGPPRRRTGSGRPAGGAPRPWSRRRACRCCCALGPDQVLGPGLDGVGDAEAGPGCARTAWRRATRERRGGRGEGRVDVLGARRPGPRRTPRRCSGRPAGQEAPSTGGDVPPPMKLDRPPVLLVAARCCCAHASSVCPERPWRRVRRWRRPHSETRSTRHRVREDRPATRDFVVMNSVSLRIHLTVVRWIPL